METVTQLVLLEGAAVSHCMVLSQLSTSVYHCNHVCWWEILKHL